MPPRLARSSVSVAAPKSARNKNKKRNLNAYAIASHSAPAKSQVKQHRLGEYLDDRPAPKRRRDSDDDDVATLDDEDIRGEAGAVKRRKATFDDGDVEEGSDSEGNEWTLGALAEDDEDSDLDSDEAFGESDEEKFEGFTFRGSSGGGGKAVKKKKKTKRVEGAGSDDGVDLDEGGDDSAEEDDLGHEGVDLATMLDDEDDESQDDGDVEGSEGESGSSSESDGDEDEEGDDEERNARMRDRLEALDGDKQVSRPKQSTQQNTLSVDDLLAELDPAARKPFAAATKTKKRSERPTTLTAPLPKRQQDRLNREVASQKAKEQLDRWRDTVIQNRRAEFLSFPLKNPDEAEPLGKDKFLETKPQNELEANIHRIMEESGMASKEGGEDEEDALMKAEGLAEQKMDVDEVMRCRAELRKARELLFYEERKAKRISKIKSRSYRRVHRRERARDAEREREEREALGLPAMDEDEREKQDRRRAEERMGTKHRDSKWAKQLKQTNRATWDEGARDSVNEEARRREELRRRVEGREDESDDSVGEDDEDEDADAVTFRQLDDLKRKDDGNAAQKGLAGMKFMRDADARRRAQNDEDVERMRKELAIEDGDEEGSGNEIDDQGLGRAIFGPQGKKGAEEKEKEKRSEMEEGSESGGEHDDDDAEIVTERKPTASEKRLEQASKKVTGTNSGSLAGNRSKPYESSSKPDEQTEGASWLSGPRKSKTGSTRDDEAPLAPRQTNGPAAGPAEIDGEAPLRIKAAQPDAPPFLQDMRKRADAQASTADAGNTDGWTPVKYGEDGNDSDASREEDPLLTRAQHNKSLQTRAFAADDVEAHFAAEKALQEASEDEKEESTHLPGWGSWTGTGLSKSLKKANARQKHNPLFKHKLPGGVQRSQRQDRGNDRVVVSEKQERKGRKLLAPTLPFGFEKREEYERSLRRPVGAEWGTKEVVQRNTRPRVVVQRGKVVGAMERPLV